MRKDRNFLNLRVGNNAYFYIKNIGIIYGEVINVKKIDNGEAEKKVYDFLSDCGRIYKDIPEVHTNDESKEYLFNLIKLDLARIEIEDVKHYANDRSGKREPEIIFCYQKEIRKQIEEEEKGFVE